MPQPIGSNCTLVNSDALQRVMLSARVVGDALRRLQSGWQRMTARSLSRQEPTPLAPAICAARPAHQRGAVR